MRSTRALVLLCIIAAVLSQYEGAYPAHHESPVEDLLRAQDTTSSTKSTTSTAKSTTSNPSTAKPTASNPPTAKPTASSAKPTASTTPTVKPTTSVVKPTTSTSRPTTSATRSTTFTSRHSTTTPRTSNAPTRVPTRSFATNTSSTHRPTMPTMKPTTATQKPTITNKPTSTNMTTHPKPTSTNTTQKTTGTQKPTTATNGPITTHKSTTNSQTHTATPTSTGVAPPNSFTNAKKSITVSWTRKDKQMEFTVRANTTHWFALVFSQSAVLAGSDLIVGWINHGKVTILDAYAMDERIVLDSRIGGREDVYVDGAFAETGHINFRVHREIDTRDKYDVEFKGRMHLSVALGHHDAFVINGEIKHKTFHDFSSTMINFPTF